jgi:hypothetical protein
MAPSGSPAITGTNGLLLIMHLLPKQASADFHLLTNNLPDIDRWGFGVLFLNDKNGNGALATNQFSLSTAYHKGLDENGYHQIGVGFQGSYTDKRLNVSILDFEDELTALGFTGQTSEIFPQNNLEGKISRY